MSKAVYEKQRRKILSLWAKRELDAFWKFSDSKIQKYIIFCGKYVLPHTFFISIFLFCRDLERNIERSDWAKRNVLFWEKPGLSVFYNPVGFVTANVCPLRRTKDLFLQQDWFRFNKLCLYCVRKGRLPQKRRGSVTVEPMMAQYNIFYQCDWTTNSSGFKGIQL